VLIMAAGRGTRMHSQTAKVLQPLCGQPLIWWPIEAARQAGADRIVVVISPDSDDVRRALPPDVAVAVQQEQLGTGDAVLSARAEIAGASDVIVLSGDHPLLDSRFLAQLAEQHSSSGAAATVTTTILDDPAQYGRIVRSADGGIDRIVETKAPGDATEEELAIKEINIGSYAFACAALLDSLGQITSDNSQGELYLGDVLPILRANGKRISAYLTEDGSAGLGINTRADLAVVRETCQHRILESHMLAGVTITDPASTVIDVQARIGADTVIEPYTFLRGQVEIGTDCKVGPMTTLTDCVLGNGVSVLHSHLDGCEVLDGCTIGPFAHIRPGTKLHERAKAGAFVEVKNSDIGEGAKVPHLSYIGDADVGAGANIAAGNITANYDGRRKHRTVIGKDVRTGVDTSFVAPVTVGDGAYTAAGSVITDDVPERALGVARSRQTNVEGYADDVDVEASEGEKRKKEESKRE
jgi:bifunctional UDP-N-acetylglucosamine pyrophosphorylase/glucosamine-1-phosphate N-acetyltransferase